LAKGRFLSFGSTPIRFDTDFRLPAERIPNFEKNLARRGADMLAKP
jgi:hypothetical protein